MRLADLAARLDTAADRLAAASTTLTLVDPGPHTLGADAPGALGALGRDLHRRLTAALSTRSAESAGHAGRLADTAHALRQAAANYTAAEDDSRTTP
jgi:hypothetical protein